MKNQHDVLKAQPRKLLEMDDVPPSMFINDLSKLFWRTVMSDSPQDNLSQGYRRMFHILCRKDGITQVELAREAKLSSPSVSAALYKMEQDGLVRRETDSKDRRKVFVYITEKGREEDNIIRERCRQTEERMLRGITDEEKETLKAILRKMLLNMLEEADS